MELAPTLFFVHSRIAQMIWILMLLLSGWAAVFYFLKKPLTGNFFVGIIVGELLVVVQSMAGLTMLLGLKLWPRSLMHFLYFALLLFTMPVVYQRTRQTTEPDKVARIWALACLFMFGLVMRSTSTGSLG